MDMFGHTDAKPSKTMQLITRKIPLWTLLLALLLLAGMAVSRQVALGDAERRTALERQALTRTLRAEMGAAHARDRHALVQQSEHAHVLFGGALAWAVRSALLQNDVREVDQYFSELVRNDRVKLALLVNAKGKVIAASNRQLVGKRFSDYFAPALLKADTISLDASGNEHRLVLPIRGLTTRLGTVLVAYAAPTSP